MRDPGGAPQQNFFEFGYENISSFKDFILRNKTGTHQKNEVHLNKTFLKFVYKNISSKHFF